MGCGHLRLMKGDPMKKGILLALALSLGGAIHAHAWVEKGLKPFPDGRAPIIIDPFCKIEDCHFSKEKWRELTRRAISQWNTADVGFTFLELSESPLK